MKSHAELSPDSSSVHDGIAGMLHATQLILKS